MYYYNIYKIKKRIFKYKNEKESEVMNGPGIEDKGVLNIDAPSLSQELYDQGIPCNGIQWFEAYVEKAYQEYNRFRTNKFPFRSEEYIVSRMQLKENIFLISRKGKLLLTKLKF